MAGDKQIAIVTGAASGIGRAMTLGLLGAGVDVAAVDRNETALATLAATVHDKPATLQTIPADLARPESFDAIVSAVLSRSGRIDILVNNAGITKDQLVLRMKRADWDSVIATNLTGAFALTQAVLKPMIRQKAGRIICISSVVGQSGNAGQANYAASKAGIIGFAKAVAQEVASRNITVNVVAPGMIDTDMTRAIAETTRAEWTTRIPLKRLGTPDDVAAAVCFFASDEAAYITGQVLAVNGGMYM
jgi:3-oxoacyl-[acyl-carrier protein] reductase